MEKRKSHRSTTSSKKTKKQKGKFSKKHPKAAKIIKWSIIAFIILFIVGMGVLVGTFVGLFGDELKIDEEALVIKHENSLVFDADGNQIAILSGGTKRKTIALDEMGEYLPKAYVAIEDERFYKHSGVDLGRTAYATVTYVLHGGSSKFGGSTITQQVIKNVTQDKEKTKLAGVMRKVKEISKAYQVEKMLSKDQILELYLNLIFMGGDDVNGVELGSIYYFDKSAKDLSIAECAFLAGINNSPNMYKPFATYEGQEDKDQKLQTMKDRITKRTKTVLAKMKELEYISKDQYDEAIKEVDEGLHFQKGEAASVTTDISYLTEAAIDQIIEQMMAESDISRDTAEMNLFSGGYRIYTTQKSDIQKVVEETVTDKAYITKSNYKKKNKETGEDEKIEQYSTPTMVIIDHKTGQVVACATATGDKETRTAITKNGYLNYVTSIKKQTGSSMKPLAVIAPGLESGLITGATVFDDCKTSWGTWNPKDYDYFRGLINMRTAIEVSANIPHAKALAVIGTEKAVEFCESIGFPNFEAEGLSLALGGLQHGVSPLKMAAGYATIANGGVYKSPTFYTKVENSKGEVIYTPAQEERRVMSEQNAYIAADILRQPVLSGTATYCAIPGMTVSAKTGTTNDDNDRWLCGFTPYYTAACWYGYQYNAKVVFSGNPAGKIWAAAMKTIHKELDNASFTQPEGIIRQTVCRVTGKLATEACGTNVYSEVFTKELLPKEACTGHDVVRICNDTGCLANEACPNVTEVINNLPDYEKTGNWKSEHTAAAATIPTDICTAHSVVVAPEPEPEKVEQKDPTKQNTNTTTNTTGSGATTGNIVTNSSGSGATTNPLPTNTTPTQPTQPSQPSQPGTGSGTGTGTGTGSGSDAGSGSGTGTGTGTGSDAGSGAGTTPGGEQTPPASGATTTPTNP